MRWGGGGRLGRGVRGGGGSVEGRGKGDGLVGGWMEGWVLVGWGIGVWGLELEFGRFRADGCWIRYPQGVGRMDDIFPPIFFLSFHTQGFSNFRTGSKLLFSYL